MNRKKYGSYIVVAAVILLGIYVATAYNRLVKLEEKTRQQWSEVNSAYQRRLDLIPNLVNVVKGQTDFERETLEKIAAARSRASQAMVANEPTDSNIKAGTTAQNELAVSTNQLIAVIESYPELKGTEAFRGLQTQLEGTERRIKFARKDYNEATAAYNSSVRSFPASIVAGIFGFRSKSSFQSDVNADKAVEIKF